ncbi:ENDOPLASMIC RETICULUM VESICLE TRANSPORTER PROTEIN [Salix purpurea]|uniref:ENDOPLASMIC RETICULUM VESICLE TRANSPORTER PROTEIN n=1 Tax=Salix purpurea TaxID=77065 RepID=A0A9Q0PCA3_SALPP|nr:ENDOPLASMIC RETICULUM VESICLE TRANSPORTER PROTEIN [Salix purpurea]
MVAGLSTMKHAVVPVMVQKHQLKTVVILVRKFSKHIERKCKREGFLRRFEDEEGAAFMGSWKLIRGADIGRHQSLPAVFFFYDLSPIKVTFTEERVSFLHFLTNVCAIAGVSQFCPVIS